MTARKLSQPRLERAIAQVQMAKVHPDTWINTDAVLALTGWSTPTLYRRIQGSQFPAPVQRGKWHGGTVLAHLARVEA